MGYFTSVLNVIFLTTALGCCSANDARRCISGSEAFVCALYQFKYGPGDDTPQFDLHPGTKEVRFVMPFYWVGEQLVTVYDAALHRHLGMPTAVEIRGSLSSLEMPPTLQYGDFSSNRPSVTLSRIVIDPSQSYALRYLDVNGNYRLKPDNISHFAALETLHMSSCRLQTTPAGLFAKMARLQHLTLRYNKLKELDLKTLPGTLTLLRLDGNNLQKLNFEEVRFPELEDLNLSYNELKEMNISVLVEWSPKLKLFSIGYNPLSPERFEHILNVLNQIQIAYYDMEN